MQRVNRAKQAYTVTEELVTNEMKAGMKQENEESCFGKMWDMSAKECGMCADSDMCGILYQEIVDNKVKEVASRNVKFLDETDFDLINTELLKTTIKSASGEMTVAGLLQWVMEAAHTADDVAAIEWIKRFIKSEPSIYTKDSLVWMR